MTIPSKEELKAVAERMRQNRSEEASSEAEKAKAVIRSSDTFQDILSSTPGSRKVEGGRSVSFGVDDRTVFYPNESINEYSLRAEGDRLDAISKGIEDKRNEELKKQSDRRLQEALDKRRKVAQEISGNYHPGAINTPTIKKVHARGGEVPVNYKPKSLDTEEGINQTNLNPFQKESLILILKECKKPGVDAAYRNRLDMLICRMSESCSADYDSAATTEKNFINFVEKLRSDANYIPRTPNGSVTPFNKEADKIGKALFNSTSVIEGGKMYDEFFKGFMSSGHSAPTPISMEVGGEAKTPTLNRSKDEQGGMFASASKHSGDPISPSGTTIGKIKHLSDFQKTAIKNCRKIHDDDAQDLTAEDQYVPTVELAQYIIEAVEEEHMLNSSISVSSFNEASFGGFVSRRMSKEGESLESGFATVSQELSAANDNYKKAKTKDTKIAVRKAIAKVMVYHILQDNEVQYTKLENKYKEIKPDVHQGVATGSPQREGDDEYQNMDASDPQSNEGIGEDGNAIIVEDGSAASDDNAGSLGFARSDQVLVDGDAGNVANPSFQPTKTDKEVLERAEIVLGDAPEAANEVFQYIISEACKEASAKWEEGDISSVLGFNANGTYSRDAILSIYNQKTDIPYLGFLTQDDLDGTLLKKVRDLDLIERITKKACSSLKSFCDTEGNAETSKFIAVNYILPLTTILACFDERANDAASSIEDFDIFYKAMQSMKMKLGGEKSIEAGGVPSYKDGDLRSILGDANGANRSRSNSESSDEYDAIDTSTFLPRRVRDLDFSALQQELESKLSVVNTSQSAANVSVGVAEGGSIQETHVSQANTHFDTSAANTEDARTADQGNVSRVSGSASKEGPGELLRMQIELERLRELGGAAKPSTIPTTQTPSDKIKLSMENLPKWVKDELTALDNASPDSPLSSYELSREFGRTIRTLYDAIMTVALQKGLPLSENNSISRYYRDTSPDANGEYLMNSGLMKALIEYDGLDRMISILSHPKSSVYKDNIYAKMLVSIMSPNEQGANNNYVLSQSEHIHTHTRKFSGFSAAALSGDASKSSTSVQSREVFDAEIAKIITDIIQLEEKSRELREETNETLAFSENLRESNRDLSLRLERLRREQQQVVSRNSSATTVSAGNVVWKQDQSNSFAQGRAILESASEDVSSGKAENSAIRQALVDQIEANRKEQESAIQAMRTLQEDILEAKMKDRQEGIFIKIVNSFLSKVSKSILPEGININNVGADEVGILKESALTNKGILEGFREALRSFDGFPSHGKDTILETIAKHLNSFDQYNKLLELRENELTTKGLIAQRLAERDRSQSYGNEPQSLVGQTTEESVPSELSNIEFHMNSVASNTASAPQINTLAPWVMDELKAFDSADKKSPIKRLGKNISEVAWKIYLKLPEESKKDSSTFGKYALSLADQEIPCIGTGLMEAIINDASFEAFKGSIFRYTLNSNNELKSEAKMLEHLLSNLEGDSRADYDKLKNSLLNQERFAETVSLMSKGSSEGVAAEVVGGARHSGGEELSKFDPFTLVDDGDGVVDDNITRPRLPTSSQRSSAPSFENPTDLTDIINTPVEYGGNTGGNYTIEGDSDQKSDGPPDKPSRRVGDIMVASYGNKKKIKRGTKKKTSPKVKVPQWVARELEAINKTPEGMLLSGELVRAAHEALKRCNYQKALNSEWKEGCIIDSSDMEQLYNYEGFETLKASLEYDKGGNGFIHNKMLLCMLLNTSEAEEEYKGCKRTFEAASKKEMSAPTLNNGSVEYTTLQEESRAPAPQAGEDPDVEYMRPSDLEFGGSGTDQEGMILLGGISVSKKDFEKGRQANMARIKFKKSARNNGAKVDAGALWKGKMAEGYVYERDGSVGVTTRNKTRDDKSGLTADTKGGAGASSNGKEDRRNAALESVSVGVTDTTTSSQNSPAQTPTIANKGSSTRDTASSSEGARKTSDRRLKVEEPVACSTGPLSGVPWGAFVTFPKRDLSPLVGNQGPGRSPSPTSVDNLKGVGLFNNGVTNE